MTREEMKSLKAGDSVMHKKYGVCEVTGQTMRIGVDLKIIDPTNKCLGHFEEICETRSELLTMIPTVSIDEFEEAFQESVERTQSGECEWQKQLDRAFLFDSALKRAGEYIMSKKNKFKMS